MVYHQLAGDCGEGVGSSKRVTNRIGLIPQTEMSDSVCIILLVFMPNLHHLEKAITIQPLAYPSAFNVLIFNMFVYEGRLDWGSSGRDETAVIVLPSGAMRAGDLVFILS